MRFASPSALAWARVIQIVPSTAATSTARAMPRTRRFRCAQSPAWKAEVTSASSLMARWLLRSVVRVSRSDTSFLQKRTEAGRPRGAGAVPLRARSLAGADDRAQPAFRRGFADFFAAFAGGASAAAEL